MKIDPFMAATGGVTTESDEAVLAGLAEAAGRFLRAGGVVSFSDWSAWSEETRDAFLIAREDLAHEDARRIALAIIRVQAHPPADVVAAAVPVAP